MKVIFLEDDRVEDVSEGYARNYLFPKKLAIPAGKGELATVEKRRAQKKAEIEARRAEMRALADKLAATAIEIKVDAGEGGRLFGSVTTLDIAAAIREQAGVEIDKKKIELAEPIKLVGQHSFTIKLFQDITAKVNLKVLSK
jgi:large subunit ribosomal protein L9